MPSEICIDEEYRDPDEYTCKRCEDKFPLKKGFEFNPNCGRNDYGTQVYYAHRQCKDGTFNDGSFIKCQKCTNCPSAQLTASPCSAESDAICCTGDHDRRCGEPPVTTTVKTTIITTERRIDPTFVLKTDPTSVLKTDPSTGPPIVSTHSHLHTNVTAFCISVGILSILTLLCVLCIRKRRTKRLNLEKGCNGEMKDILANKNIFQKGLFGKMNDNGYADLPLSVNDYKLFAPEVQAAPLNTVLNNLDVLEELILLLDPDISGAKNTRHLAAQCSFSFAWINYAYSKKEHKSPLVAVLEGVVAKNPDWTVGTLAGLLSAIDRNDAVEVLAKLPAAVNN